MLGWDPARAAAARAEMLASGRYATVAPRADLPPAKSLAIHRLRHLEQGQAGTCWAHAATQLAEVTAVAHGYKAFETCRRLTCYLGKALGDGGAPYDGGSAIEAFVAMTAEKGAGLAHEALCPYTDDHRTLATKPPKAVFDDAAKCHLTMPVDVASLDEAITLIDADHPTCIGIWWPYYWDSGQTFLQAIGRGIFGHELLITGYAKPGVVDGNAWLQLDNWHGLLYPPLAEGFAAKVPGYKPIQADATSDFWVRRDVLETVMGYGNSSLTSATDLTGLDSGAVVTDWDGMFF